MPSAAFVRAGMSPRSEGWRWKSTPRRLSSIEEVSDEVAGSLGETQSEVGCAPAPHMRDEWKKKVLRR